MEGNATVSSLSVNLSTRFMNTTTMHNSLPYYIAKAIVVLAAVAFVGNALVLAAIWRNTTLRRTNCYILIAGLALTDLSSGLLAQPIYASIDLFLLTKSERPHHIMMGIANGSLTFVTSLTLLILTLLAFERWLHMNCQRTLITVRRAVIISATLILASIPGTVFRILNTIKGQHGFIANVISLIILLFCLIVTSVCYIGVFRTIRRHKQQIQANRSSQNFGQPAINFTKYKKSALSIFYLLVVFYLSYLPMCIFLLLKVGRLQGVPRDSVFHSLMLLVFLSPSLNPLLYMWRMKDIRNEVTRLIRAFFHNDH